MYRPPKRFLTYLVHAVPGRMRLRLDHLPDEADVSLIHQVLSNLQAVREVRISPRTGSILITHDPAISKEEILGRLQGPAGLRQMLAPREGDRIWMTVSPAIPAWAGTGMIKPKRVSAAEVSFSSAATVRRHGALAERLADLFTSLPRIMSLLVRGVGFLFRGKRNFHFRSVALTGLSLSVRLLGGGEGGTLPSRLAKPWSGARFREQFSDRLLQAAFPAPAVQRVGALPGAEAARIHELSTQFKACLQARAEALSGASLPVNLGLRLLTFYLTRNVGRMVSTLLEDRCRFVQSSHSAGFGSSAGTAPVLPGSRLEKHEQKEARMPGKIGAPANASPRSRTTTAPSGQARRKAKNVTDILVLPNFQYITAANSGEETVRWEKHGAIGTISVRNMVPALNPA
ncbi:hypothetical protein [Desulfonatronum parangueonense]